MGGEIAAAGAWSQGQGAVLSISTTEYFEAEKRTRGFEQVLSRTYTELGVSDILSIGGTFAYADQTAYGETYLNQASGVSEGEMFAAWHTRRSDRIVSAVKLTGLFSTSQDLAGTRAMGSDAALQIGYLMGWGHKHAFAESELSFRRSLGSDADQFRADLTFGLKRGRAMLLLRNFNTQSVFASNDALANFDLSQLSVSAVIPAPKNLGIEIGGRWDVYTEGFDPGRALFLSIWWQR